MARPADDRWVEVSASQFSHEREGLAAVRGWLPDESPYRAWSNFEFRDGHGGWHEVDLLVLGPAGLYLIELKHYRGTLSGDDRRWQRNGTRYETSPLLLARRKAQRLASKLKDAAKEWALEADVNPATVMAVVPFIREAVLLHHEDFVSSMTGTAALGLYGLESLEAQRRSHLPPLSELVTEPPRPGRPAIGGNAETILATLMARIGLVQRREREVGSWVVQEGAADEGVSSERLRWQDWRCHHKVDPTRTGRVRFYLYPPGASDYEIRRRDGIARNEYRLSRTLHHDGIVTPEDFVQAEFGAGLVYPDDGTAQRLDLWLPEHAPLPVATAIGIVRQLGEALRYSHERGVVHRTLGAGSVWLRPNPHRPEGWQAEIRDWSFAGRLDEASGVTNLARSATPASRAGGPDNPTPEAAGADRWMSEAFRAPESRWTTDDRIRLDVFALGALAAYLLTGRPPAASGAELRELLGRARSGLDIAALGATAPEPLRALVQAATHPVVKDRTESIADLLQALDQAEAAATAPEDAADDPLDALPGTLLAGGRFRVEKRLGRGSTARGLLVTDRHAKGEPKRVLKVALDERAAQRLHAEAEVLRSLAAAKSVARLIDGPLDVHGRSALLLESAGMHTLGEELTPGTPVPLDFLQRWGRDLLDALVELDRLGVDHRDLKPGNLGVRVNPGNREAHLVLFDFSLTRAAADQVEAGTPPYRDPFLGQGTRQRFDSAAERYSAAVVLFEMATGAPPRYGDGLSLPTMVPDEATIAPEWFPPALAGDFTEFFRTALRRDAKSRFDSATAMRQAWDRIFATDVTSQTPTDEDDRRAAGATLDTPLSQAGLTARGLSALARFRVQTVRDFLLKVDAGHPYHRVAPATRTHLRRRRAQWEKRLGLPRPISEDALTYGLEVTLDGLLSSVGPEKATVRRQLVRHILGVDGRVDAFAPPAVIGGSLPERVAAGRAPEVLAEALEAWAADEPSRQALDAVGQELDARIAELGGAITLGEAAAAVLDATHESLRDGPALRRAQGLVRLALERRKALRARGSEVGAPIAVRRRDGRVILVGSRPALFDALEAVGQAAEDLVMRTAGVDPSVIVPAATAERELRAAVRPFLDRFPAGVAGSSGDATQAGAAPAGVGAAPQAADSSATEAALVTARLIRVGAELAPHAAAAASLALHHVDLPQPVALAETFRGYAGTAGGTAILEPRELRNRVRKHFPALPRLPDRPALDEVVAASGADLRWDEGRRGYVVPPPSLVSTGARSGHSTLPGRHLGEGVRDATSAKLHGSVATRSFLALGVTGRHLPVTVTELQRRFRADVVDVTGLLIDAMHAVADRVGARWDVVLAADAAPEGSGDRANLDTLVAQALPQVWAAIEAALVDGGQEAPLVLTELAPLARYRHLGELARWSDLSRPRRRAVWVIAPQVAGSRGPVIDGRPLPLDSPGQFTPLHLLPPADEMDLQDTMGGPGR